MILYEILIKHIPYTDNKTGNVYMVSDIKEAIELAKKLKSENARYRVEVVGYKCVLGEDDQILSANRLHSMVID